MWYVDVPAIYLTSIMCICGISVCFQIVVLNCYHVYPLREIPDWLKKMSACMYSIKVCFRKSRKNAVSQGDDSRHVVKHATLETEVQTLKNTYTEDKDAKLEPTTLEINTATDNEIREKNRTGNVGENLRHEWKKIARHFDCALFLIFATIHVLMILLIFFIIPNT